MSNHTSRLGRGRTVTTTLALTATMALLAACGSSKSTSAPPTTAPTSATTGASPELAAAQQVVTAAQQAPTVIPLTTPLTSAPPKGKTMVDLQCELAQCADIESATADATKAAGWDLKVIPFKSADPATLIAAMNQALQYKPVAVTFTGLPEAVWASEVPIYQKAGVALIPGYVGPSPVNSTIIGNIGGPDDLALEAKQLADQFIVASGGKGHLLLLGVPDFPILASIANDIVANISSGCTGCKVTPLNVTIPQVLSNGSVPAIVSAIQKDPSIKYVLTTDGPFIQGLPSALKAAGLNGVQITGGGASVENEQDIIQGTEVAFTGLATHYGAWLAVDMAIRHAEGMSFPPGDGGLPQQLLTKATVGTPSDSLDRPVDYAAQFKHLWKVG